MGFPECECMALAGTLQLSLDIGESMGLGDSKTRRTHTLELISVPLASPSLTAVCIL